MIRNMGEFMLSITQTEIKDLGFVKLHGHDLNATSEMIFVMLACMKCIINIYGMIRGEEDMVSDVVWCGGVSLW